MLDLVGFLRRCGYRVASKNYFSAKSAVNRCVLVPLNAGFEPDFNKKRLTLMEVINV